MWTMTLRRFVTGSPLVSQARRSLPLPRRSTPSARTRTPTGRRRRGPFLGGDPLGLLPDRGGALGGLGCFLGANTKILIRPWVGLKSPPAGSFKRRLGGTLRFAERPRQ